MKRKLQSTKERKLVILQSIIDEFIRISQIAWNYITFTGRYNFKDNTDKIDLEK